MSDQRRIDAPLEPEAPRSPLADLLRYIAQRNAQAFNSDPTQTAEDPTELKSLRYFRDTWSKLSTDQTVAQALTTAPENAGPLNSHALILQSLQLMRDTSPDYLKHFMSYANALLWLERASISNATARKNAARNESSKKRKSERG